MDMSYTASVVGASGFAGGELLRLLAGHPEFELVQATSRSKANRTVGYVHPNLRDLELRFSSPEELDSVDVLFAATPHGVSMTEIDRYQDAAGTVVDLSADFRLQEESDYDEWYDGHERPELLAEAVYALPELNREELAGADLIASGGCNATATILGLLPLVEDGILGGDEQVVVDLKVGSSEGGAGGGVYRYPEPKAVAGTNRAEVGFELDPGNRRIVAFSAIDNVMKGAAGQAVHAANVALGLDETAGLEFRGLHPVGAP